MSRNTYKSFHFEKGFTLVELLVVMAIIGLLLSIVVASLNDSRERGRDGARKAQIQEILKALELHYSDAGTYPDDGTSSDDTAGDTLSTIGSGIVGGRYLKSLPEESDRYQYCVSADRKSFLLAVDTTNDKGGSNYCNITRGPGPSFGCDVWYTANAFDECAGRF